MKLNCLIIDDEEEARELIKLYCEKTNFITIKAICSNAIEAINYLNENPIDFIFLDIEMPEINGLQFLNLLKTQPKVIFTTAYSEFALKGYEYNVIDYLLKPISFERFLKATNKLTFNTNNDTNNLPKTIKINHIHKPFEPNEIVYIEALGNYVKIYFKKNVQVVHYTLKSLIEILAPYQFIRCHKSFLVNVTSIVKISENKIKLNTNKELPIGISYSQKVKDVFNRNVV